MTGLAAVTAGHSHSPSVSLSVSDPLSTPHSTIALAFYRATACNNVIAVAILSVCLFVRPSVCPSVCLSDACIVTKLNYELRIF